MTETAVDSADEGQPLEAMAQRRRRRARPTPVAGRGPVLGAVAAVILLVALISAVVATPSASPAPADSATVTVAPVGTVATSLFCVTGAGGGAGAGATGVVVLTNTEATPAQGIMTTIRADGGPSVHRTVVVPGDGQTDVIPATGLPTGVTAASFAFSGGGVAATAVVGGAAGWSTAPCPAQVSSSWNIPGGGTAAGTLSMSLLNPGAAPAVVNLTFLTSSGAVLVPQSYQGITVGPGQLVTESLNAYVQAQSVVDTEVQATSGSVVATELALPNGPAGTGLTLLAGVTGAAPVWHLAQTTAVGGGAVDLIVSNPGNVVAQVRVAAQLHAATVEPREIAVPAQSVAVLRLSALPGWPLGAPYSVTVTATVPVVVARSVIAPGSAAAPRSGAGLAATAAGRSWLVVGPGQPGNPVVSGGTITSLAVTVAGSTPAHVTVARLAGGAPMAHVTVPPGGPVILGPAVVGGLHPLVVTSDRPVHVEAELGPTGAPGVASSTGTLLAG